MSTIGVTAPREEGRLWAIAFGLSLLLNLALLVIAGLISAKSHLFRHVPIPQAVAQPTLMIYPPESVSDGRRPEEVVAAGPRFARTIDDQASAPVEKPDFMGERDTQATSDRTPDPTAPALPSQAGIEPLHKDDFETTESNYQDGSLTGSRARPEIPSEQTPPAPSREAPPATASQAAPQGLNIPDPGIDEMKSTPPPRETLVEGPNPVDVPVPIDPPDPSAIKPTPPKRPAEGSPDQEPEETPKPPTAKPVNDPAFRGNQRKAAIIGSISRSGRSALNVADTPLGRYQATISRAVELEWQRNCVRHRDFITPGFLTVRFYVEPSGKVKTVEFVSEMEKGQVQKGFTLNSIRDAEIPAMPASLKKEFAKEPLELIFNFYF